MVINPKGLNAFRVVEQCSIFPLVLLEAIHFENNYLKIYSKTLVGISIASAVSATLLSDDFSMSPHADLKNASR